MVYTTPEVVSGCPLCWDLLSAVCSCGRSDLNSVPREETPWDICSKCGEDEPEHWYGSGSIVDHLFVP